NAPQLSVGRAVLSVPLARLACHASITGSQLRLAVRSGGEGFNLWTAPALGIQITDASHLKQRHGPSLSRNSSGRLLGCESRTTGPAKGLRAFDHNQNVKGGHRGSACFSQVPHGLRNISARYRRLHPQPDVPAGLLCPLILLLLVPGPTRQPAARHRRRPDV